MFCQRSLKLLYSFVCYRMPRHTWTCCRLLWYCHQRSRPFYIILGVACLLSLIFLIQVLVVITDTTTGRDKPAIEKAAKDLIEGSIVVIPVAIGSKPVPDLEKEFPDEDVIRTNVTDHPIKTADKIQDKLEDGNLLFQSMYHLHAENAAT